MEIPEHLMTQLDILINYQIDVKFSYERNISVAGTYVNFSNNEIYEIGGSIVYTFTDKTEGNDSLLGRIVTIHYDRWSRMVEQNQKYVEPENNWKRLYNSFGYPWKLGFK